MQKRTIRWLTIGAASLALVVAGTASVAARPGDDDGRFGFGGMRERLELRGALRGFSDGFVRSETTYQADDGAVTTERLDSGTLSAATESSVEYTLATGETATVALGEDTEVIGFTTESVDFGRGFHRERLVGESLAATDITAGSEIVVWAESQADGSFLAQRIVVRPTDEATDEAASEDDAASDDAGTEIQPAASPDAAASPTTDA